MQEDQVARGLWPGFFEVGDGTVGSFFGAGCDVYLRVFGVQDLCELLADSCIGAGDDVHLFRIFQLVFLYYFEVSETVTAHLAMQIRHVFLSKWWLGRPHLREDAGP